MSTWITICDTCKRDGWETGDMAVTDGEKLAELIEKHAVGGAVRTRRVSCLMGCTHGCNVAIQANGKLNYTVGNFTPDVESAQAIIAYAELHNASDKGQVPYRNWPTAIKGHFVTRHPPVPEDE
jgi:predicted metal-binding protein